MSLPIVMHFGYMSARICMVYGGGEIRPPSYGGGNNSKRTHKTPIYANMLAVAIYGARLCLCEDQITNHPLRHR